jgi:hypothetical protein
VIYAHRFEDFAKLDVLPVFLMLDDAKPLLDDVKPVTLATVDVVLVATFRSLSSGRVTLVDDFAVTDLALQFQYLKR